MANFKVGDRVRKIAHRAGFSTFSIPLGTTGQIVGAEPFHFCEWRMCWDGFGTANESGHFFGANSEQLAPLTDPGAEKFIASLDKLIREPQPQIRRETALHSQGNLQETK